MSNSRARAADLLEVLHAQHADLLAELAEREKRTPRIGTLMPTPSASVPTSTLRTALREALDEEPHFGEPRVVQADARRDEAAHVFAGESKRKVPTSSRIAPSLRASRLMLGAPAPVSEASRWVKLRRERGRGPGRAGARSSRNRVAPLGRWSGARPTSWARPRPVGLEPVPDVRDVAERYGHQRTAFGR